MTAATTPDGTSRAQLVQRWLLGVVLAVLLGVMAVAAWSFVWPTAGGLGPYAFAPVSSFELGSVTSYQVTEDGGLSLVGDLSAWRRGKGLVWVVRFPDGDFRAFSGASTHLGGVVVWQTEGQGRWDQYIGVFVEPGHSERWAMDGTRLFGPAPRNLDVYRTHIDSGVLVVELGEIVRGERSSPPPPPYDVTSGGWATSGWPSQPSE